MNGNGFCFGGGLFFFLPSPEIRQLHSAEVCLCGTIVRCCPLAPRGWRKGEREGKDDKLEYERNAD